MSPTSSQQWARRIRYSDQDLRVSDAERNAVAESLGVHFSDGRLDQAEFDERVSRAMAAKTRGDLEGLFDDLPDPEPAGAPGKGGPSAPYRPRRRHGSPVRPILFVALVIALAVAVGHTVATIFIPWFWVAVFVVAIVLVTRSTRARRDR
jgi:Flp pilus assembly protein TadB